MDQDSKTIETPSRETGAACRDLQASLKAQA
jgi:hypothetical protein